MRLWELDQNNRSSFNEPSVAVDLKKLANATTSRVDFSASKYGTSKGFSPDNVEMEVAASCFGGEGKDDEDGWSSMTLWVAMTEGDVYALCPFLPSKFCTPPTLLPSLSTSVVAKANIFDLDQDTSELQKLVARHQSMWLRAVDEQEPTAVTGALDMEVYSRPNVLSAIPRLQGPFQLSPEPDFGEITDIHVIAPKVNDEALFDDEEDFADLGADDGLSIGIVCLATSTNKVHVCLNVEGVEAEWLPSRRDAKVSFEDLDAEKDLLLLDTIDLAREEHGNAWPTLTRSPGDRYEVFSTQPTGIYSISVRPWIGKLEAELAAGEPQGVGIRLGAMLEANATSVDTLTADFPHPMPDINAAIALMDDFETDLGYIVLTAAQNQPFAAMLDIPSAFSHPFAPDEVDIPDPHTALESRAPYQPADVFFQQSTLPSYLEAWRRESATGATGDVKGQVNFSPYTLQKITEAHRTLSAETHNLGIAAADLFRRCERMMSELKTQVGSVKELSNRINSVTGEDEFPEQPDRDGPELVRGGREKIANRIQASKDKTHQLRHRVDNLRRNMRGLGGKELSAKERAFAEELASLERNLSASTPDAPTSPGALLKMENSDLTVATEERSDVDSEETLVDRFKAVEGVFRELMAQAEQAQKVPGQRKDGSRPSTAGSYAAHGDGFRQQKLQQVFALLERESALVEAVGERLERLMIASR